MRKTDRPMRLECTGPEGVGRKVSPRGKIDLGAPACRDARAESGGRRGRVEARSPPPAFAERRADVLVRNPELPPYVTVIGWLPLLSVEVVNVACPAAFRVAVPRVLFLSLKVTVPVGTPPPEVTVAVKVTGWLKTDGFRAARRCWR